MTKGLKLLDQLVAAGRNSVTPAWVMEHTGMSREASVNLLTRLVAAGLLDRVGHGHYAVRQFGVLGTSAAAEDLALAVGALFEGRPHRIAFRSALQYWNMLTRPWTVIQVACSLRVGHKSLSGRPLRIVHESPGTLSVGAVSLQHRARISDAERALLDCAARLDLAGGIETVAEALMSGESFDVGRLAAHAKELGAGPAIRRIGSLAENMGLEEIAFGLEGILPGTISDIELDPSVNRRRFDPKQGFRDGKWRVRWRMTREDLANAVLQ